MFPVEVHQQASSRVILEIKGRISWSHEFEYDLQITSRDIPLLISQTAVRIDRSHTGGVTRKPLEREKILSLKAADAAINISTYLCKEKRVRLQRCWTAENM